MYPIPTYIINLKKRTERKAHVLQEFQSRQEFEVNIVEAQEHAIGAVGLWYTVKHILQQAINNRYEYILICEDDHQFSEHYSIELLFNCIATAREKGADVLSGGVSWFNNAMAISEQVFWVEKFSGFQFTIIFSHFFETILKADFIEIDGTDLKLSSLTTNTFFIFPFISVQKDFGYSDVTPRNSEPGRVEALFQSSLRKADIVRYIYGFYEKNKKANVLKIDAGSYDKITIPTYVITLPEKTDRTKHIQEQFQDRTEFDLRIVEACKHTIGTVGLWLSFRKVIEMAVANDDDVIIICEDDHEFTNHYSKEVLLRNVMEAYYQRMEVLTGGIYGFDIAFPVSKNRYWINAFFGTTFLVMYKNIFRKILEAPFDDHVKVDGIISELTSYKATFFPFISGHKEFGADKEIKWSNKMWPLRQFFTTTADRLELTQRMYDHFHPQQSVGKVAWSRSINELLKDISKGPPPI